MRKIAFSLMMTVLLAAGNVFAEDTLVVYCGITMMKPMTVIAKQIETTHNCKINIVQGGSGKLLKLLLKNKNGDLYLPGSDSYIKKMDKDYPGLVVAKESVGYNRAAIFVKKGNPRGVAADLNSLLNPSFKVIIGSAEKGSIGKVTKKILEKKGIYDQVMKRAKISLHSKGLMNALKAGAADISINWYAVSTWPENEKFVDALPISGEFAQKKKLVLAQLKDSGHPAIAKAFLDLAASEKGRKMFNKFGLAD